MSPKAEVFARPMTPLAARILAPMLAALPALENDARDLLELLVRVAPTTPAARQVAQLCEILTSTLVSRFARRGIPSVKCHLARLRLVYAAAYFDEARTRRQTVAQVAYRLECSTPQSLGRTIRQSFDMSPGEYGRRMTFGTALAGFMESIVTPYAAQWAGFRPLYPDTEAAPLWSRETSPAASAAK